MLKIRVSGSPSFTDWQLSDCNTHTLHGGIQNRVKAQEANTKGKRKSHNQLLVWHLLLVLFCQLGSFSETIKTEYLVICYFPKQHESYSLPSIQDRIRIRSNSVASYNQSHELLKSKYPDRLKSTSLWKSLRISSKRTQFFFSAKIILLDKVRHQYNEKKKQWDSLGECTKPSYNCYSQILLLPFCLSIFFWFWTKIKTHKNKPIK